MFPEIVCKCDKKYFLKILTINLLHWNLSKYVQVRSVENSAKDPIRIGVVGINQSLIGYSICNKPHPQEEKEEEDVLHLSQRDGY